MLQKLEVGKKYPSEYNFDGNFLEYDQSGFTLYYFMPNMTITETQGLKTGKYKFAITEMAGTMFLLSEFKPGLNLSDTPFHFGLYKDGRINYLPKEIQDGQGLSLMVVAVDSATGIVKVLRQIGLSTQFSRKLIEICVRQASEPVNEMEYNMNIMRIQNSYQAKDLYRFKTVECKG